MWAVRIPIWRWTPFVGYAREAPYRYVMHLGWWLFFWAKNPHHKPDSDEDAP
jgi:hypothetical protein